MPGEIEICKPEIKILSDFDGYFKTMVESLIDKKVKAGKEFKHKTIEVSAGPFRAYAVMALESREDNSVMKLDFYSALRKGFGEISEAEIDQIVEML